MLVCLIVNSGKNVLDASTVHEIHDEDDDVHVLATFLILSAT